MRNSPFGAEAIQHLLPGGAEERLAGPRAIVNPGMDDFTVARADSASNARIRLDHEHLPPCEREAPCDGEAHDAGTDHCRIDTIHRRQSAVPVALEPAVKARSSASASSSAS